MVAPKNDDGVVRVGTCFKGVQDTANHGVGITYVCEVAMDGIVPSIQRLQLLNDAGTGGFHLFDLLGKIGQVIFFDWGKFDFVGVV